MMVCLDWMHWTWPLMGHQHPGLSDLLKTSTVAMVLSWKTGGDCQLWVRDKLLPQVEELKYLRSFFPNNLMGQTGAASATRALYWSAVVKKAECKSRAVDFTGLSASLPSPVASVLERGRRVWVGRLVGEVFQAHNTGRRTRGKPGTHSVLGTPLRFPPPEWAGGGGWGKEGLGCLGCCPHSLTLDEWMHYCWGVFFPYSPDYEDINMTLGCYSSVVFLCIK